MADREIKENIEVKVSQNVEATDAGNIEGNVLTSVEPKVEKPPAVPPPPPPTEAEIKDAQFKLRRYCYIGNLEPFYVPLRGNIKVDVFFPQLQAAFAKLNHRKFIEPFGIIISAPDTLFRRDEAFFALATFLTFDMKDEERHELREAVPHVLKTANDLFLFCKYSRLIRVFQQRKGFSRTTKKIIIAWYDMRNAYDLRQMWLSNRGLHGFSHKNLIRMCHINDQTLGDKVLFNTFFKSCTEIMKEDSMKDERAILDMSTLRTTTKKAEALRIIRTLHPDWDQVPHSLWRYANVVELLVPKMDVIEIIKKWHIFQQYRHFDNENIFRMITSATSRSVLQRKNLHPTVFLCRMDRLGIPINAAELSKIPQRRIHQLRVEHLHQIYYNSFRLTKAMGLRVSICMTLQESYKKKFISKRKKITYYDAAVGLAFTYFKRERNVDVYCFTNPDEKPLEVNWERRFELQDALAATDKICIKKSKQAVLQPLIYTMKYTRKSYDLFLLIVPTAGRGNPSKCSQLLYKFLERYRREINDRAKFVIVSLLRNHKSMSYSLNRNEHILEICGLDSYTGTLIDNFAAHRFG